MSQKLPTVSYVAMTALAMGKQHLVSVVIPIQSPIPAAHPFLACRFSQTQARHRFARYWSRLMKQDMIIHDPGEMVYIPVAPLGDGRSESIGRLVTNPGNGREFGRLVRAAGWGLNYRRNFPC